MPAVQRFPMGIPYGWYFVAYSDELKIGDVRSLHYFGRDLVLFRNESGQAGVLDAYCPHMGAHLGDGGVVEGDVLRCPFHAWAFRPDGFCVDIPYAKAFPPICKREAVAGPYPVTEANGVIWAWYHPTGEKPLFEVLSVPEFTEAGWAAPTRREWRFASNPQEIAENGVDVAHFEFVHKMNAVPEGQTTYDAHILWRAHNDLARRADQGGALYCSDHPKWGGPKDNAFDRRGHTGASGAGDPRGGR